MSARPSRRRAPPPDAIEPQGNLDAVQPNGHASGWCWSPAEPALRRDVVVLVDGQDAARGVADLLRDDLARAGIGDGGHGFSVEIPQASRPAGAAAAVTLRDAATGRAIGGEIAVVWERPAEPLTGNIDVITRDGWVSGWCWEPDAPERRITLDVLIDDTPSASVVARESRPDLLHARLGDGCYGFNVMLPYDVLAERGAIRVRLQERGTGRRLGEPAILRIGRRAEADSRLQELERQVTLMRGRIAALTEAAARQPEADTRAARDLFATVAGFFRDLSEGAPPSMGLRGGVGPALEDLRGRLPAVAFRPASLGPDGRPAVTIAVPASTSAERVHECLAALRATDSDLLGDIVLLDPAGTDPRCALLPALVAHLRVGPAADGLAASFRRLLLEADTDIVALVSPDVLPTPGWLAALLATMQREAAEGARPAIVGAVALRPDGLLQHAGFVRDAGDRFRDLGHLAAAGRPAHRFLRPVDAVGALAFVVDRAAAAAAAFDPAYRDLSQAIAELCLNLSAEGRAVLLQPDAEVLWQGEEATDPAPDMRGSAEDSRRLRLAAMRLGRDERALASFVGHALVVDDDLPQPDRDAGSVAALDQMLVLRRLGWRVTFAAAGSGEQTQAHRRRLERVGIEIADRAAYPSVTDYVRANGAALDLVHLYRHRIASLLLPPIRDLAPRAKIVFSPADLHFLREAREAALAGRPTSDSDATRGREVACARAADATILLSDHERDVLAGEVDDPAKLHLLRWIARPRVRVPGFSRRSGLLFVGHFRHAPNVDAAIWMAGTILPLLHKMRPDLTLDLVGAHAPPSVRALAGDAVRVRGWVEDLTPLLDGARLTVAPLRYGAGFKGKLATSLAAGVPVVGTPIAFEGTGLADGDGIAIAADPPSFAAAVLRVHDDAPGWEALSVRARERVEALYSPNAAAAIFRALLADIGLPSR